MPVEKEKIKRIIHDNTSLHEVEEHHPAFAVANISRISGGSSALFGSSIRNNGYIMLEINKAHRTIDHGYERYTAVGDDRLISIKMTSSQFAELITTHNIGEGVPVTLRYHRDGEIVSAPDIDVEDEGTESERVVRDFIRKNESNVKYLKSIRTKIEEIFDKKSINKTDRKEILDYFNKTCRWLDDTSPFMVQMFVETMEKTVSKAKTEIDAFVTSMVYKTGLDSLKKIKLLENKDLEDEK